MESMASDANQRRMCAARSRFAHAAALRPTGIDQIKPDHHQFYGIWRLLDVDDGLPKYEGYAPASLRNKA